MTCEIPLCFSKRNYPAIASDSDDEDVVVIEDLDNKMASVRSMFPGKSDLQLKDTLMRAKGDVENAIDILIGLKKGDRENLLI